jgi:hypothetical protein
VRWLVVMFLTETEQKMFEKEGRDKLWRVLHAVDVSPVLKANRACSVTGDKPETKESSLELAPGVWGDSVDYATLLHDRPVLPALDRDGSGGLQYRLSALASTDAVMAAARGF